MQSLQERVELKIFQIAIRTMNCLINKHVCVYHQFFCLALNRLFFCEKKMFFKNCLYNLPIKSNAECVKFWHQNFILLPMYLYIDYPKNDFMAFISNLQQMSLWR